MSASVLKQQQGFWHMPKTFYAVLFIEFWERFAFYGLQSVAVLFFINKFGLKEQQATDLFSSFSALLYAMLVIGGYLGDKVLGLRRAYFLGIIFLMIGYGSFGVVTTIPALYTGMGLVLVGNILFKTNAGNYVNRCFKANDPRLDVAFTYFYMSINLGSFFSMIAIPLIAQKTSYAFGIGVCGIGMFIALLSYFIVFKRFMETDNAIGKQSGNKLLLMLLISLIAIVLAYGLGLLLAKPQLSKMILLAVSGLVVIIYFMLRFRSPPLERRGMTIAFILLVQSVFFWVMYMQMATSLTLFAVHNVRNQIFGIAIPPEVTQSFNPFYIFLLSPLLANLYMKAEHKGKPISIPGKFAWGMLVCGLAYLLLASSCYFSDAEAKIALVWLFLGYGLYSLGELLISAIGLAMVSKLLPTRLGGFAQAVWFVACALGQKLGGTVAGYAALDDSHVITNSLILHGYQHLFACIGLIATTVSIVFFMFVKPLATAMQQVVENKIDEF